ncbi:hypothetical protein [Bacillus pinisoli]|nr:hypothetical protein [Bacillus pinisoli]
MKRFDELPKTIKKTIRYIKQDANIKQLNEIELILNETISNRLAEIKKS